MAFAPELLVPFFIIVATIFLLGMSQAHASVKGTSGIQGWIEWLAHGGPFAAIVNLVAQAERWLVSKFAATQIKLVAAWFSAFAVLWRVFFQSVGEVAHSISAAVSALDAAVPRIARHAAAPALREARLAHRKAIHADAHAGTVGHSLQAYKARTTPQIRHATHAIDVTLPHDIAGVRQREEALSRDQAKLRERTSSLENGAVKTFEWIRTHPLSAVTGVFAAAVAVALSRLGMGFIRCRSWRNLFNRLTCGMGQYLLDALEALAVFALSLLSVLKPQVLAEEAVAAVDVVEGILTQILNN
jgi:hypothetical protein